MANFKQNNKHGGRPMHKAVCSKCGKDCEVPFKPTGEKPVFCNDCFKSQRDDKPRRFGGGDKKMYQAVCAKCGKRCEVPFKPAGDKPVYCNQCYGKGGKDKGPSQVSSQGTSQQLEAISAKLDAILRLLTSAVPLKADEKKKPAKKTKVAKPKPKKVNKPKPKKAVSAKKAEAKAEAKAKAENKK